MFENDFGMRLELFQLLFISCSIILLESYEAILSHIRDLLGKNMAKILISPLSFSWSRTVVYLYIRAIACQIEYNLLYSSGWQWLLSRVIKVMLFNCQGYMATLVESYQSY